MRHVTVSPGRVPSGRRARLIDQAGLTEQRERLFRQATGIDRGFGSSDLIQVARQVDGPRTQAAPVAPRDRLTQCPVHLEDPRPIAEACDATLVQVG